MIYDMLDIIRDFEIGDTELTPKYGNMSDFTLQELIECRSTLWAIGKLLTKEIIKEVNKDEN